MSLVNLRLSAWRSWLFVIALFLFFNYGRALAAESVRPEPAVKATYIYKIAQFTEWPTNRFAKTNAPIVIGVLGRADIAGELESIARTYKINGRPLVIRRLNASSELTEAHILFIGKEQKFEPILSKLQQTRGVLAIGEHEAFAERGGMINFVFDKETVKFQANPGVAREAGVEISSLLLDVVRNWGLIIKTPAPKAKP